MDKTIFSNTNKELKSLAEIREEAYRQGRMANNKSVTTILEEVSSAICDHYCKYPEEVLKANNTESDTDPYDVLMEKYCAECPLGRL